MSEPNNAPDVNKELSKNFVIADNRCFCQNLNPIELAVYFRICMRGHKSVCYESIKNIAVACNTSEKSVQRSILKLTSLNMIKIMSGKNTGKSNSVNLIDYENWVKINEVGHTDLPGRSHRPTPSVTQTYPVGHTDLHNSTHANRTLEQNSLIDARKKPASEKKQSKKRKTWEEKTYDEKLGVIDDLARDAIRKALTCRKAHPFNFDNVPDLLLPILKKHEIDLVKKFFEMNKTRAFDIRNIENEIEMYINPPQISQGAQKHTLEESKPMQAQIISKEEESFKIETILQSLKKEEKIMTQEKEENFPFNLPLHFQSFFLTLQRIHREGLKSDYKELGHEKFLKKMESMNAYQNYLRKQNLENKI